MEKTLLLHTIIDKMKKYSNKDIYLYSMVFKILTKNETILNYSLNTNSILFHLNNISLDILNFLLDKLVSIEECDNTLFKNEEKRYKSISDMRNTIKETYKNDIKEYMEKDFKKHSTCINSSTPVEELSLQVELSELSETSDVSDTELFGEEMSDKSEVSDTSDTD